MDTARITDILTDPVTLDLVERHAVTIMLATPTFLRAYLRKAEPAQLRSLRLLVTGAEKLPDELAKAFEARFGHEVLQGYGLTEIMNTVAALYERRPAVIDRRYSFLRRGV